MIRAGSHTSPVLHALKNHSHRRDVDRVQSAGSNAGTSTGANDAPSDERASGDAATAAAIAYRDGRVT
jgi:hypothetical protein